MQTRLIKFRAWDDEKKRWLTDYEECYLSEDGVVGYIQSSGQWDRVDSIKTTKAIPSFFTGLKDKNGKEIYEGDIVKHMAENPDWDSLNDDSPIEIEVNSVVEYKGHGFWLSKEFFWLGGRRVSQLGSTGSNRQPIRESGFVE